MIEHSLARIGLAGTPAKVYLACIELGCTPVARVVSRTQLPKATVYDALERLRQQGLVHISEAPRNRLVHPVDPSVLLEHHESERQRLLETLPLLKALFYRSQGKPNIRFYEGDDGLETALFDSLSGDATELQACFSMEELDDSLGMARVDAYLQERVRRGKWLRVIRSRAKDRYPVWPCSRTELREVRYAPPDMVLAMTFVIYGNSVALMSSRKEGYGLVIDSEEYASLMRALHQGIWQLSEPAPFID